MTIGIIGIGLIGGSMAKDIKNNNFASKIIGYNRSEKNSKLALKLGLIDEIVDFNNLCEKSDFIIIGTPVNISEKILPEILNNINENTVVTDVGSTKENIINEAKNHPKRNQFVASHPMSGTEKFGPESALEGLFNNKVAIICDSENSNQKATKLVYDFYKMLGSRIIFMNPKQHDEHVGYVSHLSHIISYALASAVLEKEKSTSTIFDLAAGGFESTVRLAKSPASMWAPIFEQNSHNILPIINIYIEKLSEIKSYIENKNQEKLYDFIEDANRIIKILNKK